MALAMTVAYGRCISHRRALRVDGGDVMLAINFHLMGGMPSRLQPMRALMPADSAPVAAASEPPPVLAEPSPARSATAWEPRPDAPPEVVVRRPVDLGVLLAKVRENLL
jgi:hypothetical protein